MTGGYTFLGDGAGAADLTAGLATKVDKSLVDAKGDLIAATANDTPARVAVGGNGQVLVGDSNASTGLRWSNRGLDQVTSGELVPSDRRLLTGNQVGAATQTLVLTYFAAEKTETVTTITAYTGTTAAGATPTLCRYGVYSVAANGDLTLIASTPNDTTLWAAAQTAYPKALSASWAKVAGSRYALALLQVTSATAASFTGCQMGAIAPLNTLNRLDPAITGRVTGQTDLPASIAVGSIIGYQAQIAMLLT